MKHKILIVEDEVLERTALRKMIESNFMQAEIVGEASSGRQAMELVELYHPDIITMDIRLPGMDGLQTIEEIKRSYPHISFIILSAFDTFSYAKRAISLGVHEYLLKPYDEEELCQTLQNVLDHRGRRIIERLEHLTMKDQMEQVKRLAETELVTTLLQQSITDISPEVLQEILGIHFLESAAINLSFDQENPFSEAAARDLHRLLKQELHSWNHCLLGPLQDNQLPIILYRREAENTSLKYRAQLLWKQLIPVLKRVHRVVSCGVGNTVSSPELLGASYKEAVSASAKTAADFQILFYDQLSFDKEPLIPWKYEQQIVHAFQIGEVKEAQILFEQVISLQFKNSLLSVEKTKEIFYELFLLCSRTTDPPLLWNRDVFAFSIFSLDHKKRLMQEFENLCRQRLKSIEKIHQNVVYDTIQYLKENYQQEISLEAAAQRVHLSPPYLSKLIKESTGATFVDHLSQLRISKAKELLRTTNMSLKEICFSIGYHDPNYFSKVFRKYENISPRDYRQNRERAHFPSFNKMQ